RDRINQLAGRINGVGDGVQHAAGESGRRAFAESEPGVGRDGRRRLGEVERESAGGGSARAVGDGEVEAVVVVRAVVRVGDLAVIDVVLRERAIYRQGVAVELERAMRRRGGDGVDELAGGVAGVAGSGQLAAGDGHRRAFGNADAGVDRD